MSNNCDLFEDMECISCFIAFKVPNGFTAARRKDGRKFYCPQGHHMYFPIGESETDKLRGERDRLAQRIAQKDDEIAEQKRKVIAVEAEITKIKKRAAAGLCPCCNRHFTNLERHLGTKHPGYVAEPIADEHVH